MENKCQTTNESCSLPLWIAGVANDFFGMRMWTCPIAIRKIQEEDYPPVTSILGYILYYTGL